MIPINEAVTISQWEHLVSVDIYQACDNAECHQIVNKGTMIVLQDDKKSRGTGLVCFAHLITRAAKTLSINLIVPQSVDKQEIDSGDFGHECPFCNALTVSCKLCTHLTINKFHFHVRSPLLEFVQTLFCVESTVPVVIVSLSQR